MEAYEFFNVNVVCSSTTATELALVADIMNCNTIEKKIAISVLNLHLLLIFYNFVRDARVLAQ